MAGTLDPAAPLITRPAFQAPPHTAGRAAITGDLAMPGAASLAHLGVLYLDQAPEFAQDVLHALRQPLASGTVTVSESGRTVQFPARFILVLAASPCPCSPAPACTCTPLARRRYLARLSGLLDRIEVHRRTSGRPGSPRPLRDAGGSGRAGSSRASAGSSPAGRHAVAAERPNPRSRPAPPVPARR